MAELRRKLDRDFREGAVRLVRETGKPVAQVARDLGINKGIPAWRHHAGPARVDRSCRRSCEFWSLDVFEEGLVDADVLDGAG